MKPTKGIWTLSKTNSVMCEHELIAIMGYLRKPDETRLKGESWLCMRERTEPERIAINEEQTANASLIADAGTVFNSTGLTPSELLESNKELRNSLEIGANQYGLLTVQHAELSARNKELTECLQLAVQKYSDEMTNPFCMEWFKKAKSLLNSLTIS